MAGGHNESRQVAEAELGSSSAGAKLKQMKEAVTSKLPAGIGGSGGEGHPKDTQLYDALGVAEDASKSEIKTAYKDRQAEVWRRHTWSLIPSQ